LSCVVVNQFCTKIFSFFFSSFFRPKTHTIFYFAIVDDNFTVILQTHWEKYFVSPTFFTSLQLLWLQQASVSVFLYFLGYFIKNSLYIYSCLHEQVLEL
jgi:hypothetical protein